jgi:hypothetical protein
MAAPKLNPAPVYDSVLTAANKLTTPWQSWINSIDIELSYVHGVTGDIQTQLNGKEPSITNGLTTQYWRGDKTFHTLDTSVVPENTNLYFTTARARDSISATLPVNYDNTTGIISYQTRSFFSPAETAANFNNRRSRTVSGSGSFRFNFFVPNDFNLLVSAYVIGYPTAGAAGPGKNIDINVEYTTTAGSLFNQFSASDTTSIYDLTGLTNRQFRLPITNLLINLAPSTEGGILVTHNAIGGDIDYIGVLVVYN